MVSNLGKCATQQQAQKISLASQTDLSSGIGLSCCLRERNDPLGTTGKNVAGNYNVSIDSNLIAVLICRRESAICEGARAKRRSPITLWDSMAPGFDCGSNPTHVLTEPRLFPCIKSIKPVFFYVSLPRFSSIRAIDGEISVSEKKKKKKKKKEEEQNRRMALQG